MAIALTLFDRVEATYQPPAGELDQRYLAAVGVRGTFQVARRWSKDDPPAHAAGAWAMRPLGRHKVFPFDLCPHTHLVDMEPAQPE